MAGKATRGEQREKRKFWEGHLEKWMGSGMTQAEYCRRHNLNRRLFSYWKRRLKRPEASVSFIPVRVKAEGRNESGGSSGLVLWKEGYRIEIREGFNAEVLGQVLRTLEGL